VRQSYSLPHPARIRTSYCAPRSWFGILNGNETAMGHRLIAALIWLNALGLSSCVVLIAAALVKDDAELAGQVALGVLQSLRLFVVGAALPAVAWGITAFEFDRRQTKKRMLESVVLYILLIISLIVFVVAGWRLPQAFITGWPPLD